MFSIEGKLYGFLTIVMNLLILDLLFLVIFIPILTAPVALLFVCQGCINMIKDAKIVNGFKFDKKIWVRLLPLTGVTICSVFTITSLFSQGNVLPNYVLIAIIISFVVMSYIMVILYSDNLFVLFKSAFYYTVVYFYKTVVPIFFLLLLITHPKSFEIFMSMLVIPSVYFYLFLRINYKSFMEIKWLTKRSI